MLAVNSGVPFESKSSLKITIESILALKGTSVKYIASLRVRLAVPIAIVSFITYLGYATKPLGIIVRGSAVRPVTRVAVKFAISLFSLKCINVKLGHPN